MNALILAVGSPAWFDGWEFWAGWACSWVTVGPLFVYWFMKRTVNDAIE
jgi:hypothetical protein